MICVIYPEYWIGRVPVDVGELGEGLRVDLLDGDEQQVDEGPRHGGARRRPHGGDQSGAQGSEVACRAGRAHVSHPNPQGSAAGRRGAARGARHQ